MCDCTKLIYITAKCRDMCDIEYEGQYHDGYVPSHLGIGEGDYISFAYCPECGKVEGEFPLKDFNGRVEQ